MSMSGIARTLSKEADLSFSRKERYNVPFASGTVRVRCLGFPLFDDSRSR